MRAQSEGTAGDIPDYEAYDYESEWRGRAIQDRAERELVTRWADRGGSCLELGGGFGRLTLALELKFEKIFMVDFSKRNLTKASERLKKTRLIRASIDRIPFEDSTFDSVVVVRVLHHLPDLAGAIEEMARVARDGGCIIMGVPNTSRRDGLTGNTLVACGPQGHKIYAAPISAYAHPLLQRVGIRGLGLFDNRLGRGLRSLESLFAVDVATSSAWAIKPQIFIKFRVRKGGPRREPRVICPCGSPVLSDRCGSCGRSYGKIIDLTQPPS
ncbi:MAG: class I SAM-dependent methyltransferase [Thaumarchaeota archaeon]|nr:class I SAM-dependent methyltransferase [Nitrososphaerota archaeon]